MGKFIAEKTIKLMIQAGRNIKGAKVNVLGLTFKENCPDLRNSKVPDIIAELGSYGIEVAMHDPLADAAEAKHEYGLELTAWDALPQAEAVIIAVAHRAYLDTGAQAITAKLVPGGAICDVKACFAVDALRTAGLMVWRL